MFGTNEVHPDAPDVQLLSAFVQNIKLPLQIRWFFCVLPLQIHWLVVKKSHLLLHKTGLDRINGSMYLDGFYVLLHPTNQIIGKLIFVLKKSVKS